MENDSMTFQKRNYKTDIFYLTLQFSPFLPDLYQVGGVQKIFIFVHRRKK